MAVVSAGLLMCRVRGEFNFFLVHPGGPFFRNRNEGIWTIPKGLVDEGEDRLLAAQREFFEETGIKPTAPYYPLGSTRMKSGKQIFAWAFAGEWNEADGIKSNTFELEWPPRSRKRIQVPEADKGRWMSYEEAVGHVHPAQKVFLDRAMDQRTTIIRAMT